MQISLEIKDRDVNRFVAIGLKPWGQVSEEERKEYERLISFYGTLVAFKAAGR